MDIGETLYVKTAAQWRAWLKKYHKTKSEVWLVYYTKASGKPTIPYNDAVDEAMCFGWIDSIVKKLVPSAALETGADGRAQRFTPRRPKSPLSEMNKERARRLIKSKRMTKAGLDAIAEKLDEPFVIPPDIAKALKADRTVWRNFDAFPESYKRIRIGWIHGSRNNAAVFKQRLDYFIRMTKQNKRFGMVQ